jgi:hypothetical protein
VSWGIIVSIATTLQAGWSGGSNAGRDDRFFCFPNYPDQLWGPPRLLINGYQGSFMGVRQEGCDVDHSPAFLTLRLIMCGAIPLLPLYAYMVWIQTTILDFTIPTKKALHPRVQRLKLQAAYSNWCSQHM